MIVRDHNVPEVARNLDATICWMDDEKSLNKSTPYILQQTTRRVKAFIKNLNYQLDVNSLHRAKADTLKLNEIGRVEIETAQPVFIDPYKNNRETGSFILIDPSSNQTVAAGMIRHTKSQIEEEVETSTVSSNVSWEELSITRKRREERNGHNGHCLWFTGLSGSGKSTIAKELQKRLFDEGKQVYMLDGDNVRHGLCGDLGFSDKDRDENIRRVGHAAQLLFDAGNIVLCSFISPKAEMREYVRSLFPEGSFTEVFINANLDTCIQRDPKGLYKKALMGEIPDFTGVDSEYEAPVKPEIEVNTNFETIIASMNIIYQEIMKNH